MNKTLDFWKGKEGNEYIKRNPLGSANANTAYKEKYGISRTDMNKPFLENIPRDIKILEVGCSTGAQLDILIDMGFGEKEDNIYGIEPNTMARHYCLTDTWYNIINGIGSDIPFKDEYFDLTFTSGVLIHLPEEELEATMKEIYRVTKRWLWSFEYYNSTRIEIEYRGEMGLLWKDDYAAIYIDLFPDLELIKEEFYYFEGDKTKVSTMFLLEKRLDAIAWESIKCGQLVAMDEYLHIHVADAEKDQMPIGMAARDIEKGDFIDYNPKKNTEDILIKTKIK